MLELAEKLIAQKSGKFDPNDYEDRYEDALMEMIKEKLKGHKPIIATAPERGNVINLMDALKALARGRQAAGREQAAPGRGREGRGCLRRRQEAGGPRQETGGGRKQEAA